MSPCGVCGCRLLDKGRGFDGRRFYRCRKCDNRWSEGLQGRERKYSEQRIVPQFKDTGAAKRGAR